MSAVLKVVEKDGMENKNKALDAALAQIERAIERAAGNRGRAAQSLGISRATLWRRMRALGMED